MFAPALRLAKGKVTSETMRVALEALVERAAQFDAAEEAFPADIARHKALRGEAPSKLNKRTQAMLEDLAGDQVGIQAGVMAAFEQESRAESIVWSLSFALRNDLQNAEGLLKHYPEVDRPLGVQQLDRKRELLSALDAFLVEFPVDGAA